VYRLHNCLCCVQGKSEIDEKILREAAGGGITSGIKKRPIPVKVIGRFKQDNKMKDSKKHRLGIVDFRLVDQGLSHLEALVYQYVQRFEKNKRPCFASIPHIAAELRLSEPSTKRYIQRLIKLGMLRETTKGRGRYLNTTGIKMIPMNGIKLSPTGIKLIGDRDQIDPCDRDQNDPLPLKVLPKEDTNKKIPLSSEDKFKLDLLAIGVNYDDLPD
jgi:predicted DNA-binding transcriptional regulator